MKYPGSIVRGIKRFRRIVAGKRSPTFEKTTAERRYRRHNTQATRAILADTDRYDDETFQAPRLTSWDLW